MNDAYTAYVSTKFGARGPSMLVGMASKALFEDGDMSLGALEERLALLQQP